MSRRSKSAGIREAGWAKGNGSKDKGGRPPKEISEKQVFELAKIDCSYAEMASVLGCDESTLTRRFAQAIKRGRAEVTVSLKRAQFKSAMNGNVTMQIWLGKVKLGQKGDDESRFPVGGGGPPTLNFNYIDQRDTQKIEAKPVKQIEGAGDGD